MISFFRGLRRAGVLSMNARNADYVDAHNPRRLHPLVNNKLQTKQIVVDGGLEAPELYAVLEIHSQGKKLSGMIEGREAFVLKPAHGAQGDGIIVVDGKMKGGWRKANGLRITEGEIAFHVSNILSGMYSLGGHPDVAMVEYRVAFDPLFDKVTYQGVPDMRIIVFKGVPAMGMVRLPTRESDGKANLHKGGLGVGLDMASGLTTWAIHHDRLIDEHPDTGHELSGIQIPEWTKLLEICSRCYDLTGLGYLGVDVVLDRDRGPMILELNARPGLSVQIANRRGLRRNLEIIAARDDLDSTEARVAFARETFGNDRAFV